MNRSDSDKMTPFDRLISSKGLQMLKLLIPYTPVNNQRMLGIYVKFMELEHTIQFFRHVQTDIHSQAFEASVSSPLDMLDELRPYLPESEQDKMDSFLSLWNLFEMVSSMEQMTGDEKNHSAPGNIDPLSLVKTMLNPEQQEMFEMYSNMFQDDEQPAESEDSHLKGDENDGTMDESSRAEEYGPGKTGTDSGGD